MIRKGTRADFASYECFHKSLRHRRARIHLYIYLEVLQEKAIYCDTDSVVYIQPRDKTKLLESGDRLGNMTPELRPTDNISEFVGGVTKNYAYRTVDTATGQTNTVCKVRGITLNYSASQLVKFKVIRDMILWTGGD